MKRELILGVLTGLNLVLLVAIGLMQILPVRAAAQDKLAMLRGSGLEIVDDEGRVRASISIQPKVEGASETVLFRLINPNGQPSVKIAASATGAGLSFVGGDDASYVILDAEGPESRLKMVEPGDRERLVEP